jgi:hypothetical protein
MLQLMREYGSELSETAVPPRRDAVQKASVVRQFRRWNPTFFEHFHHRGGRWVPKLGKKGELERRAALRARAAAAAAAGPPAPGKKPSSKHAEAGEIGNEAGSAASPATGRRGGTAKGSFKK